MIMSKYGLVALVLSTAISSTSVLAMDSPSVGAVRYRVVGCADQGGEVDVSKSGADLEYIDARFITSNRIIHMVLSKKNGRYFLTNSVTYEDESSLQYTVGVELGQSFKLSGMIGADYGNIINSDLNALSMVYRKIQDNENKSISATEIVMDCH